MNVWENRASKVGWDDERIGWIPSDWWAKPRFDPSVVNTLYFVFASSMHELGGVKGAGSHLEDQYGFFREWAGVDARGLFRKSNSTPEAWLMLERVGSYAAKEKSPEDCPYASYWDGKTAWTADQGMFIAGLAQRCEELGRSHDSTAPARRAEALEMLLNICRGFLKWVEVQALGSDSRWETEMGKWGNSYFYVVDPYTPRNEQYTWWHEAQPQQESIGVVNKLAARDPSDYAAGSGVLLRWLALAAKRDVPEFHAWLGENDTKKWVEAIYAGLETLTVENTACVSGSEDFNVHFVGALNVFQGLVTQLMLDPGEPRSLRNSRLEYRQDRR